MTFLSKILINEVNGLIALEFWGPLFVFFLIQGCYLCYFEAVWESAAPKTFIEVSDREMFFYRRTASQNSFAYSIRTTIFLVFQTWRCFRHFLFVCKIHKHCPLIVNSIAFFWRFWGIGRKFVSNWYRMVIQDNQVWKIHLISLFFFISVVIDWFSSRIFSKCFVICIFFPIVSFPLLYCDLFVQFTVWLNGVFYPLLKRFITFIGGVLNFICDPIIGFFATYPRFLRCKTIYKCEYRLQYSFHLFINVWDFDTLSRLLIQNEEKLYSIVSFCSTQIAN